MNDLTGRIIGAFNKISLFQIITIILVFTSLLITEKRNNAQIKYQQDLLSRMDTLEMMIHQSNRQIDSLNLMHPWKKKMSSVRDSKECSSTILGKLMWGNYSKNLHVSMVQALETYTGPKTVVNSTRRYWNKKSKHCCGKAIDLKLCDETLEWLISDEGLVWMDAHNITMYIEDRPSSKLLHKYESKPEYAEYVFRNPKATGPHIHLNT